MGEPVCARVCALVYVYALVCAIALTLVLPCAPPHSSPYQRHAAAPSSSAAADYCLRFDLSKTQDASEGAAAQAADGSAGAGKAVRHVPLCTWGEDSAEPGGLRRAWHEVTGLIDAHATRPEVPAPAAEAHGGGSAHTVCRIALASLGAPLWWPRGTRPLREGGARGGRCGDAEARSAGLRDTLCFLHALKGKVRGTDSVVLATIPPDLAATNEVYPARAVPRMSDV